MSDERDKYEKVLAYTEVALARSQRRSDQLSLAVSVLAGGVVAVSFAVLPITAVAVWARLLLGLLSFAALMACGLVLMVADPTMRTGATDPTAVAQQALNPMTDPLQTVTSHLIIARCRDR